MSSKFNSDRDNFDINDFDDVGNIDKLLKEFELNLPDEDDAFFDIEDLESLEDYLIKIKDNSK